MKFWLKYAVCIYKFCPDLYKLLPRFFISPKMICATKTVDIHGHFDVIVPFDLFGIFIDSPSPCHCKCRYKHDAHVFRCHPLLFYLSINLSISHQNERM